MKKIKIAQIGTSHNSHGLSVFASLKKQSELFEVAGFALPENEREKFPERMGAFEGYPEMTVDEILSDPEIDAVAVETEEIYLTKYALLAARQGKHIHMEKPGGIDLAAFEELISTVKEKNLVFHVGYMYRYNPFVTDLLEQIKLGELGKISCVEAQMSCFHPTSVRNWLKNFPGGMMIFLGCHLVDLVLKIQGPPKRVIPLNKCSGLDGESEDIGMAVLEYENGVSFVKTSAVEPGGFSRRQLVVTGSEKSVEIKPLEMYGKPRGIYTEKTEYSGTEWLERGEHYRSELFDRYDPMMSAFARYVRGEEENPNSPDYEFELYKTLLKCCGMTDGRL